VSKKQDPEQWFENLKTKCGGLFCECIDGKRKDYHDGVARGSELEKFRAMTKYLEVFDGVENDHKYTGYEIWEMINQAEAIIKGEQK
jgi:hypothetical protein